jgi:hypothetical protein
MERLSELISKLKEQFDQKADTSKLLGTTLLIERELMKLESSKPAAMSSSNVSVMMPAARNGYQEREEELLVETPAANTRQRMEQAEGAMSGKQARQEFHFDPLTEIPTLSQQQSVKEINEII